MKKDILKGMFALLLFVFVQAPFIYSFDCSQVSPANYDTCVQINSMNLSGAEKDIILSNLDYQDTFFPNHQYIFDRNTNLIISDAPDGVNKYQGIFVKDVWSSIFAIMPSVLYNNTLFVPNSSQVLTGFNLKYVIPSDYSGSYPNTNNGDCKRTYSLIQNISENKIFVNDVYQGSGKLVNININQDSTIKSIFNVQVSYSVDHYSWEEYCASYHKGVCITYQHECTFNYNEIRQDNIIIPDSINVTYYNNSLFADLETISSYSGNTNFNLDFNNSVKTNFQDSLYLFNEFTYSADYSKSPYYILTLKAEDYKQEQINNLFKQGNNLIVKNPTNCSLEAFDFFNYFNKSCYAEQKPIDFRIETDKLKYFLNETINVSVYPQNISVNISYGNQSKIIMGNTSFISQLLENKITAFNGSSKAEKIIYVQGENRFGTIFNLSIFGFVNYFIYVILRKCFGGLI